MKLTALYGQLFTSKHGLEDNGVWFKALSDLTSLALDSGLDRLMNLSSGKQFCEYPPNALQFRALCLAFYEDLRLPAAQDAYREVKAKAFVTSENWSHPAVRYTAKRMGLEFLTAQDDAETFALFKKSYEKVCHLIKQGHSVPESLDPVLVPKPQNQSIALGHLNKMRHILGVAR